MIIQLEPSFAPYAEAALGRLRYLFGECNFVLSADAITVGGYKPEQGGLIKREISYQLYREKIYQETLPMRMLMYRTLLS